MFFECVEVGLVQYHIKWSFLHLTNAWAAVVAASISRNSLIALKFLNWGYADLLIELNKMWGKLVWMMSSSIRNLPWLYKSYCLSDMQICYQSGKIKLSFYKPASMWIAICQPVYPTSWQIYTNWQVSNDQQHFFNILAKWLKYCVGMCWNKCRIISFG